MSPHPKNKERKIKKMRGWAEVGSHGLIFEFVGGSVAERYPNLLHIYSKKVSPDLIPVEITYSLK